MPAFFSPDEPIHTCDRDGCESCPVRGKLVCHFNDRQLTGFFLFCLPVLAAGLLLTALWSLPALIGWIACLALYFGLIEIRVMCSHCPHYAQPETRTLTCWANYGAPKLWAYRPGPMSIMEKAVFSGGMITVFAYPVVFAILAGSYLPLAVYLVFLAAGAFALRHFLCVKCFNFACPLNRVGTQTRELFFQCNPAVRDAWQNEKQETLP